MEVKLFEVRDTATCIPVMAIKLGAKNSPESWLLGRAGYGSNDASHGDYVLLAQIDGGHGKITCDPFDWAGSRTLREAHKFIAAEFDALIPGQVIDVRVLIGESSKPAESDRFADVDVLMGVSLGGQ